MSPRKIVRRDASALMRGNADWRQRTSDQQPAAIPQHLEPTRSLASASINYSHDIADFWVAFAIEAKRFVKFMPLRDNSRTLPFALTRRAITIELQFARPSRSFGQLGNRYCEHGLDESDLAFRDTHDSSVVVVFKCRTQPTAPDRRSGLPIRCVRNHLVKSRAISR